MARVKTTLYCSRTTPKLERMIKDFDSAARAHRLKTAAFSIYGGAVTGMAGLLVAGAPGLAIGWLGGSAILYVAAMAVGTFAGDAAASLYMSKGATTPAVRDYSLADALAARGKLIEAAEELERCAVVWETDPEPRLRLARLLRDRLNRPEDAATGFVQVMRMPGVDDARLQQTARELVELCRVRLGSPERALPPLARLAAQRASSPLGHWANQQIAGIRADLRHDGPDTD